MKFLSWMQSKLQGKVQSQRKESHAFPSNNHETPVEPPEETNPSLPLVLLAIGTFGNNELRAKPDDENVAVDDPSLVEETDDCSLEDVPRLEEELRELLQQKTHLGGEEIEVLPLEKLPSSTASSEVDGRDDYGNGKDEGVEGRIGLVISEWKDDGNNKSNRKSVAKRSVSFLVKKLFVCGSGFALPPPPPTPNFTNTLQDSRMTKILKMMLHKKIYPKNSSQMASLKRFIKEKEMRETRNEDELDKENNYGCNVNSGSKPKPIQNVN